MSSRNYIELCGSDKENQLPFHNQKLIDLTSVDDDDDDKKPAALPSFDDDGLEIVVRPESVINPVNLESRTHIDGDDVVLLGTVNEQVYPHARHDCPVFPLNSEDSKKYCDKCFCFMCDSKAGDCPEWEEHSKISGTQADTNKRIKLRIDREEEEKKREKVEARAAKAKKKEEEKELQLQKFGNDFMEQVVSVARSRASGNRLPANQVTSSRTRTRTALANTESLSADDSDDESLLSYTPFNRM